MNLYETTKPPTKNPTPTLSGIHLNNLNTPARSMMHRYLTEHCKYRFKNKSLVAKLLGTLRNQRREHKESLRRRETETGLCDLAEQKKDELF